VELAGPALGDRFAKGLSALEKNWDGAILENGGIDETLKLFQTLEREAGPREKRNWRFQQALYRAYYDAYVRMRLKHETAVADAARAKLNEASQIGSAKAMDEAVAILDRGGRTQVGAELRGRVAELAEALFQSISAQLSVPKYQAIEVGRGANLDAIDTPLSDAAWLRTEIAATRQLGDEGARRARLHALVYRDDPGPGGFYDDLGDPLRQPHLVRGPGYDADPAFYVSPLCAFGRGGVPPASPRAWWTHAEAHFDAPLQLRYSDLDRAGRYRLRVVYARAEGGKVRLTAGNQVVIHDWLTKQLAPLEFDIPAEATLDGGLTLTWSQEAGVGGNGRGCQVAEVWLLKREKSE
jgi:hypothetical protein